MPNVLDELRADHENHVTILALIENPDLDPQQRYRLFEHLARELCAHVAAEERNLYARLAKVEATRRAASHSIMDHQDIEELMETLYQMDPADPHWLPSFKVLRELIEHHQEHEERTVFQLASEMLDLSQTGTLVSGVRRGRQPLAAASA